jgi:hypothetical protein
VRSPKLVAAVSPTGYQSEPESSRTNDILVTIARNREFEAETDSEGEVKTFSKFEAQGRSRRCGQVNAATTRTACCRADPESGFKRGRSLLVDQHS